MSKYTKEEHERYLKERAEKAAREERERRERLEGESLRRVLAESGITGQKADEVIEEFRTERAKERAKLAEETARSGMAGCSRI